MAQRGLTSCLVVAACLWCVICLGGCVAAAAVPLVAAGATASEKGYAFWDSGTLRYTDEATLGEMSAAVSAAAVRLGFGVSAPRERSDDGTITQRSWRLTAGTEQVLRVRVRPVTGAVVSVAIEAGTFGNRSLARLFADRLKDELEVGRLSD